MTMHYFTNIVKFYKKKHEGASTFFVACDFLTWSDFRQHLLFNRKQHKTPLMYANFIFTSFLTSEDGNKLPFL